MKLIFSSSFVVFSFILVEVFHSAHAAKEIFTFQGRIPAEDAFSATSTPLMSQGGSNSDSENIALKHPLKYFNVTSTSIFVHYNGFISVDASSVGSLSTVANQLRALLHKSSNFMAIYWQQYEAGNVYSFAYHHDQDESSKTLTPMQLRTIAYDLTNAFSEAANTNLEEITKSQGPKKTLTVRNKIDVDEIMDVYVITWLKMQNVKGSKKQNTFQALLIRVMNEGVMNEGVMNEGETNGKEEQWYLKTYLAALDTNGILDGIQDAGKVDTKIAQIGIGINNENEAIQRIDFQELFDTQLPTIFELVSNEWDFLNQSSYSFDLNADAKCQPLPPFIDCNNRNCFKSIQAQIDRIKNQNRINPTGAPGPTGQPITSTPGTTLSPIDPNDLIMDLERFCLFRSNGEHALPANCDVFIYCSNGIGSFAFCPNGTKFNPVFLTCDYAVNHECKFDTLEGLQPLFTQPPSQSNNLCFFKGFGEVVDPLSCDHYYACTNTRSIRMVCPAGLHFRPINAEKGICDYPRDVECSGDGVRPNNDTAVVTTQSTTITTPVAKTTKYHPRKTHQ